MLDINSSFAYGINLGFAGFVIGLSSGIYLINMQKYDSIRKYSFTKNCFELIQISFVLALIGFIIGYLFPFIFNSFLLIFVGTLIFMIIIYCLKLIGYNITLINIFPQNNQQNKFDITYQYCQDNDNNQNIKKINPMIVNYSIEIEPTTQKNKSFFSLSRFKKTFF